MTEIGKPKIEELADEQALWSAYRELRRTRGINVDLVFPEWAAEEAQKLPSPGARQDFDELCKDGCLPQVLAAIIVLIRFSPLLETFWAEMVGSSDNRQKATRNLEKAAATLEGLFGGLIASEDENQRAEFLKIGRLPFSSVVSELRFYIRLINGAERIAADVESHSLQEVCKYLLSSYVRQMTGRFHDRNVSALIGQTYGPSDYEEVAQRMWRNRNYQRLDKHLSFMAGFLVAMSVVISHRA
jgi:hypothetical protein